MKEKMHYTLILGAEDELGKALAREVARKKCNLLLVSTSEVDLLRFAIGLQLKEDVQVEAMKLDLGDRQKVEELSSRLNSTYEIKAFINNIGYDCSQADFTTRFRGSALLTMGLMEQMKRLPSSYMQLVIPFPFRKSDMSEEMEVLAGKMLGFAKELEEELKDTGIGVSIVHPSPIRGFIPDLDLLEGISDEINNLKPRLVAMKAINGMLRGDRVIIPGFRNRLSYFLSRQASLLVKQHSSAQLSAFSTP